MLDVMIMRPINVPFKKTFKKPYFDTLFLHKSIAAIAAFQAMGIIQEAACESTVL